MTNKGLITWRGESDPSKQSPSKEQTSAESKTSDHIESPPSATTTSAATHDGVDYGQFLKDYEFATGLSGEKMYEQFMTMPPRAFDYKRVMAAILFALNSQGVRAWNGDGTGMVANMVSRLYMRIEQLHLEYRKLLADARGETREVIIPNSDPFADTPNDD